jgi:biopolymer transport protein ExbB
MDIIATFTHVAMLGSAWVLWLLVILSIVSVAIIFERYFFFKKTSNTFLDLRKNLESAADSHDRSKAKEACTKSNHIGAQVGLIILDKADESRESIGDRVSANLAEQKLEMSRGLMVLGTLGNNAPFIGLFGTVLGIIQAFQNLSLDTAGGAATVMAGISEALVATAVGLIVAIPAVIAYNGFTRVIKQRTVEAEICQKLVLSLISSSSKK